MYYEWIQTHKKHLSIGAGILVFLFIAWTATTLISRIGKLPLTIQTVPSDAQITLGDQTVGNGTTWAKPGTYTLTVRKNGFTPQTKRIIITSQKQQNVSATALVAESDATKKWADQHSNEYLAVQEYGSIEARNYGTYIATKYPITKSLPFNDPYYQITYTIDKNDALTLTIATPSPRYRYFAVQKLRDLGYNPTDYVIHFKDFHNPLSEGSDA